MNMQPVTGKPFHAVCCSCGQHLDAGDGAETREHDTVYADLDGEPWKSYYCTSCKLAAELY